MRTLCCEVHTDSRRLARLVHSKNVGQGKSATTAIGGLLIVGIRATVFPRSISSRPGLVRPGSAPRIPGFAPRVLWVRSPTAKRAGQPQRDVVLDVCSFRRSGPPTTTLVQVEFAWVVLPPESNFLFFGEGKLGEFIPTCDRNFRYGNNLRKRVRGNWVTFSPGG